MASLKENREIPVDLKTLQTVLVRREGHLDDFPILPAVGRLVVGDALDDSGKMAQVFEVDRETGTYKDLMDGTNGTLGSESDIFPFVSLEELRNGQVVFEQKKASGWVRVGGLLSIGADE